MTLESFRVAPCGISHERIVFAGDLPTRATVGGELMLARIGLCGWQTRATQLTCAHTTARIRFVSAVKTNGAFSASEAEAIERRVIEIGDVVQLADWTKGALESAYALAVEAADEAEIAATRAKIAELEARHAEASAAMQQVVDEVLRAVAERP